MNKKISLSQKKGIVMPELYKLMMLLVFAVFLIIPIVKMLIGVSAQDISRVFARATTLEAILNSLSVTTTATIITVVLAYFLALCVERTTIKGKIILGAIVTLPMLIPSISHGMGLILLLGNNGIITRILNLSVNIYGFWGIVIGSVMYACPVAFIMLRDIMRYEDGSPYEAATVLGLSNAKRFFGITLPFLRKPLISVIASVFTMIVTDYGVPLMVGGKFKTVSVVMYQDVIGQLDFKAGSVYGIVLLVPAIISFIIDFMNKDKGNSAFVVKPVAQTSKKRMVIPAYIYCAVASVVILLPIISFLILGFTRKYPSDTSFSLYNLERVLDLRGGEYLLNSVIIAFFVAFFGIVIGFITAYFTARMKTGLSKLLHLVSIIAMAVPGIVLGLSYAVSYNKSVIYGTLVILIMVNITHFIASPYLMMYNSFAKLNENLEPVGETLGIKRWRLVKDVFLPQSVSTLAEMFLYFFVNSMMTISAVSFLANTQSKPISLMINQFEAQMQLGNAGIVSLFILIINLLLNMLLAIFKKSKKFQ